MSLEWKNETDCSLIKKELQRRRKGLKNAKNDASWEPYGLSLNWDPYRNLNTAQHRYNYIENIYREKCSLLSIFSFLVLKQIN